MLANSSTKKVKIALMGGTGRMGQLVKELAKSDSEIELSTGDCDILIDFSSPEGTKKAIEMGKPLVCGTTGLSDDIIEGLSLLAQKVPVLYAPNFSLGMALCFKMLEGILPHLFAFKSTTIEETHHKNKKDAPSGTALKLASFLGTDQIKSQRLGEVIGDHQIKFTLENETITLSHQVLSRKVFAQGALAAAKFIFNKPAKLYSLTDLYS